MSTLQEYNAKLKQLFGDTATAYTSVFGIPWNLEAMFIEDPDPNKIGYHNTKSKTVRINTSFAKQSSVNENSVMLAGVIASKGLEQFAYDESSPNNKENFDHLLFLEGICIYGQLLVKEELQKRFGYEVNISEEERRVKIYLRQKPVEMVGWCFARRKHEEAERQGRIIKHIIEPASRDDNFSLFISEAFQMSLQDYVHRHLEEGTDYEVVESLDTEIQKRIKNFELQRGQLREVRDVIPDVQKLRDLLSPEKDREAIKAIENFLKGVETRNIRPTDKLDKIPEYSLSLQQAFIEIMMDHPDSGRERIILK
jgi:hypothetical protein